MKYSELKESQRLELGEFPICFAFTAEQLDDGLKKLKTTKEGVVSIGGGGFIRKTDKAGLLALFERQNAAMKKAMEDDVFLVGAIIYELANHEFCITYDPADVISVLGLDMDAIRVRQCFKSARNTYLAECEDY